MTGQQQAEILPTVSDEFRIIGAASQIVGGCPNCLLRKLAIATATVAVDLAFPNPPDEAVLRLLQQAVADRMALRVAMVQQQCAGNG